MEDARTADLIQRTDALYCRMSAVQRELFANIAEMDRAEAWGDSGARDMAHWLWMRYGLSDWKAHRWIAAAHALEDLPTIADAFCRGELGIDKMVELTRFATPETESRLIPWAQGVSCGAIRHKADLALRREALDAKDPEETRYLSWSYFDDGKRFGLEAELPAAQGAVVARALERLGEAIPVMPGEEDPYYADARRADALVAMCSARIAGDPDPDRATVIIHAREDGLVSGRGGCEIEGGAVIHPETARRLGCTGRVQRVIEDEAGRVLEVGRMMREPSSWMMRQLRYRDYGCTFDGCGTRRFLQAHHIVWYEHGGRTDPENLLLTCFFHHKLVHEHGWAVTRDQDGTVRWFRPDGTRYRAGPAPPPERIEPQPALSAVGF
jgi:hypothetical protein